MPGTKTISFYYKATVIRTVLYWPQDRPQDINGTQ